MLNEEQNGFFAKPFLAAVPIVSTHLEDKYGFECKVDYDKDFATDEYYSLKLATYKKKIVGDLEIHITDTFKFVEALDTYKYQSTIVEIVQGIEFQEIKIDKMWQLLMLIDMLQGVQLAFTALRWLGDPSRNVQPTTKL